MGTRPCCGSLLVVGPLAVGACKFDTSEVAYLQVDMLVGDIYGNRDYSKYAPFATLPMTCCAYNLDVTHGSHDVHAYGST